MGRVKQLYMDELEVAEAKVQILTAALMKIAAYGDVNGQRILNEQRTYAGFDEPAAVEKARDALMDAGSITVRRER